MIDVVLPPDQRWCVGYEGKYAAAYNGDIISYVRGKPLKLKGGVIYDKTRGYHTYKIACLSKEKGVYVSEYFHRLVATAWIPNPENKQTVNHINHEKLDNRVDNLEWATFSENIVASYEHHGENISLSIMANKGFESDEDYIEYVKFGSLNGFLTRKTVVDKLQESHFTGAGVPFEIKRIINRGESFLEYWNFLITYLDAVFIDKLPLKDLSKNFNMEYTIASQIRGGRRWQKEVEIYNKYRNNPEYIKNYKEIYKLGKIKLDKKQ